MESREDRKRCNPPQSCLVACPYGVLLERIGTPVAICVAVLDVPDDPDASFEIVLSSESDHDET